VSLKRRERRERARRGQELREELRAEARSDDMADNTADNQLMPRGPSVGDQEVLVWHEPSGQMLPLWTARSLDKAALNDAKYPSAPPFGVHPDAVVAAPVNPPRVRDAEQKEEAEMRQGSGRSQDCGDCGDDCGNEGRGEERRKDAGSLKMAKAVAGRGDQEPEPDLEEEESDPEEEVLQQVLACMERFSGKLDELEELRARNAELERVFAVENVGSEVDPQPLLN
jgi:hypothetical protein